METEDLLEGNGGEVKREERGLLGLAWDVFGQELKAVSYLSGPMVAVNWSLFFLQIISLMMVGHLGKLALSSTAIAISLCAVSGFSVIYGQSCALETLCGQSYGAQQYQKFGVQIHTAIFCLNLSCLPLCVLWMFLGKLLVFLGQNPLISHEAGKIAVYLIPALFGYATLQALIRFYIMQSLTNPLLVTSSITLCFHIAFCWLLVLKSGIGSLGAAFAIGSSYWLNVILLGLYMKFSSSCAKTRVPISMELFLGIREFFGLAVPSAGMICLEWWSFELLTLISGLLPNPELETSILSVCVSTTTTLYTIPEAIGSAASTRVSNALGAGNPRSARVAVFTSMFLTCFEALLMSLIMFAGKNVLGYVFSSDGDVVAYFTDMIPLLCLYVIVDSLHGTVSGIATGIGLQQVGAYVNLGSYYALGLPIAATLGFWVRMQAKGLWIGIMIGSISQLVLLSIIISCTDWKKEARNARERIFQGRLLAENDEQN
ncbi:hypothetical protein QN277_003830 [Acacia crassicarpa]|uniref:Protein DETOXIFICATION n=1 Tax=Acacia crassicarpa TaxID=499986 RepID=A0AAE1MB86_9FABA|nr:hypothetical protein QN277_003830 [Acacia crassicarpa]